jgi:hypothetical protein
MDLQNILAALKRERDNLSKAIAALEGTGIQQRRRGRPAGSSQQQPSASTGRRGRRHMSPAARKRISEMMKQRWAERRRKAK